MFEFLCIVLCAMYNVFLNTVLFITLVYEAAACNTNNLILYLKNRESNWVHLVTKPDVKFELEVEKPDLQITPYQQLALTSREDKKKNNRKRPHH